MDGALDVIMATMISNANIFRLRGLPLLALIVLSAAFLSGCSSGISAVRTIGQETIRTVALIGVVVTTALVAFMGLVIIINSASGNEGRLSFNVMHVLITIGVIFVLLMAFILAPVLVDEGVKEMVRTGAPSSNINIPARERIR